MSSPSDEKDVHDREAGSSWSGKTTLSGILRTTKGKTDVDAAWKFLNSHRDASDVASVNLDALRRKIDWHIVPLMFCCYTMQFLDKVILNVRPPKFIST